MLDLTPATAASAAALVFALGFAAGLALAAYSDARNHRHAVVAETSDEDPRSD